MCDHESSRFRKLAVNKWICRKKLWLFSWLFSSLAISSNNKGIRFLLCVIDIFSKYAWVIPSKDRKRYYDY